MSKAVDLLIITGDSSVDFVRDFHRIKKDVRAINHSMYEFHTFLGMRVLGPYKAAWAARQHGYDVQVISKIQLLPLEKIIELCEHFIDQKTIIGVGTSLLIYPKGDYSSDAFIKRLSPEGVIYKIINTIKHFRSKYNNKVIVGGSQAVAFKEILSPDHVIQGDAENQLPQLLDRIKRSGIQKKPYDWQITGCDFKWHESDCIVPSEPVPIETSRGCIFKCKFCQFENLGKKVGTFERPLSCVREEIINNFEKYKTTHYWLTDDTFNDNNERVNQFCEMVESLPFRINFMGYLRLDLAHRYQDTARRLYKAGLVGCSLGIESFHPEASKAVGKSFSSKHGKEFLDYFYHDICEANITINCCNIIGLPGEFPDHIEKTIDWYKKRPHIHTNWSSLNLNDPKRIPTGQSTSVFEREAEKYGYTFFPDRTADYWERGGMSSVLASEIRQKVVRKMKPININAGEPWSSLHYLSILKMTPKEARKIGWLNLYTDKTIAIQKHNSQYFDLLQKYEKQSTM